MPKRTRNMIRQVQELSDRAEMYGDLSTQYRGKANSKYRRIARPSDAAEADAEFAYMNPDLDNWDGDGEASGAEASQAMRKEYAGLCDQASSENLDLMLETIGRMREAGATRSDMDRAWSLFNSAQS